MAEVVARLLLLLLALRPTSAKNGTSSICPTTIIVDYWNAPPYFYKETEDSAANGIVYTALQNSVDLCCESGRTILLRNKFSDQEALKTVLNENNGSVITGPFFSQITEEVFMGKPYFPVIESPGLVVLVNKDLVTSTGTDVVTAILSGWPILVLSIVMAVLSGMVIWCLDSKWNENQFPRNFFAGSWEGFWWAFVSMTTVGYGDRAPVSIHARMFAFVWVLIGIMICSIFTATLTTALTSLSMKSSVSLFQKKVGVIMNSQEYLYALQVNAKPDVFTSVESMFSSLMGQSRLLDIAIVDAYTLGYYSDLIKGSDIVIESLVDETYSMGFAVNGQIQDSPSLMLCFRSNMNTYKSEVIQFINNMMSTSQSLETQTTSMTQTSLLDPSSTMFLKTVLALLILVASFALFGIIWEFGYWRPRNRVARCPEEIKEAEQIEDLVYAQIEETENVLKKEVESLYRAWMDTVSELEDQLTTSESTGDLQNNESKTDIRINQETTGDTRDENNLNEEFPMKEIFPQSMNYDREDEEESNSTLPSRSTTPMSLSSSTKIQPN